jgi:AcrR family transcriptional regulator
LSATDLTRSPPLANSVPRRSRYQKLRAGVRGPNGLSGEQVKDHQRTRLYEAMVEIAASKGYPATTIKAMCSLAGVSRQTFYDLFGADKEACFIGAYDHVVGRAAARIKLAYCDEQNPDLRVCRAFEQFTWEAASEPQAARFALLEPFGAGPAALARMDRGREMFEGLITASMCSAPHGAELSPTIAKGIVGGVERVARAHLLAGNVEELRTDAHALSGWVSCYRPWSHPAPAPAPKPEVRRDAGLRCKDQRLRILRAAAAIAAKDGYFALSRARITRLADVSDETFASLYGGTDGIESCFLGAFELCGLEALLAAATASRHATTWPGGVRSAITALLDHISAHPFLGRLAFVEIFSVGLSGIERRSRLLERFTEQLVQHLPHSQQPSELVAEAIVGAIWAVIHDYVVRGQVRRLGELADQATYLALAPVIGHEAAVLLLIGDPRAVCGSEIDAPVQADRRKTPLVTYSAAAHLES